MVGFYMEWVHGTEKKVFKFIISELLLSMSFLVKLS